MQQAITWASVDTDLWCQMASLGLNELTQSMGSDMTISIKLFYQAFDCSFNMVAVEFILL